MTDERIIELLKIERACVVRNVNNECDRDCAKCDLVQEDKDILELYDTLIKRIDEGDI